MSGNKLNRVLAQILRDFKPWTNPDRPYRWGDPHLKLTEEEIKALPPFSVYLALVTFSQFPHYGRSEKIAWSVPLLYKSVPYLISHQKFGLRIHSANSKENNAGRENELTDRLIHAVKITDGLIAPYATSQIRTGNVTIANQSPILRSKYEFFRGKAKECYEIVNAPHEASLAALNHKLQMEREGFFFASAALDAYFSYLEHLLVLMLAFCDFKSGKIELVRFINTFWAAKFKRIFDLGADNDAERIYQSLVRIKEKFRNPLSHGGFNRDATTLYFHVPGLGAIPMSLSRHAESIHYGLNPIDALSFKEVCDVLDRTESFFATGSKRLELRCVMSGIDVAFDEQSRRQYRKAIQSDEAADAFIELRLTQMDDATNMDW